MKSLIVRVANPKDQIFADEICSLIAVSAKQRGTGIAKRSPEYILQKINSGNAVIATMGEQLAGFCYIEAWSNKKYVANSGLIVKHEFRGMGVARKIKKKVLEHSRKSYPNSKVFGLTTSLAVMKINSNLGYIPVTYDELTHDNKFWEGCKSCVNYEILQNKQRKNCLCTAMVYDPKEKRKKRWGFMRKPRLLKKLLKKEIRYVD